MSETSLHSLQDLINERETERNSLLKRQFLEYASPLASDIEEDEENLMKAYRLYCQLVELNDTAGDSATHLRDFALTSPLCRKDEYTIPDGRFAFLRLWFNATNPDALYIPQIQSDNNNKYVLTFIDKELWKPTLFEKQIMQVITQI